MTTQSFVKIAATQSADVATNGTITLAYPATYSSANVNALGAQLWAEGLNNFLNQGTGKFSVAYGGTIVITYLGATTIPAGTKIDFFLPVPGTGTAITDSTGGTASSTIAAITAGASYAQADATATKNGLATLAAKVNAILAALASANINLP